MADLTTTQLKLRTTPTAGVASEQSPYYRRLLSAGYKGFLQGTVGGSTLYGIIGAGIGAAVALPLLAATGIGFGALALIPAMGGLGLYKGATTFGSIGSFAAITAESAEMSEKRRYLLDRYYDLPDTPDFDDEAEQIRNLLAKQHESKPPHGMFHWRTVAVGAAIGAAVALAFLLVPGATAFLGGHVFVEGIAGALTGGHAVAASAVTLLAGTALGGLAGGVIGLDRYYVRSWLDGSAKLMHDSKSIEEQIYEREQEIEQLGVRASGSVIADKASTPNAAMKINVAETPQPAREVEESHPHSTTNRELPINPRLIAGLDAAPHTVAAAKHEGRVSLDQALARPVL